MSSEKGLSHEQVTDIIQFLKDNGWQETSEPNQYLHAKFIKGNNNVKIYSTKGHGYTLVCNTELLRQQVLAHKLVDTTQLPYEVEIDDAGVGCPVGGVAVGFKFSDPKRELHKIVDVKYFQSPGFEQKEYLEQVTTIILDTLQSFISDKTKWLIKICTGYVFSHARAMLAKLGYNVTPYEITGSLQDSVEHAFRHYLEVKCHIPTYLLKSVPTTQLDHKYFFSRLIQYIRGHVLLLPFCKTGWPYFKKNFSKYIGAQINE